MEAFSRLYLNDYELLKDKNDVYGVLISVFSESDKIITQEIEYEEESTKVRYILSYKNYSDKLDIMGFTLKKAYDEFFKVRNIYESKSEFIKILNKSIEFIIDNNIYDEYFLDRENLEILENDKDLEDMVLFILRNKDILWGGSFIDIRFILRIVLSLYSDSKIIYDVSEIIANGYFDEDFEFSKSAKETAKSEYIINEKIIVLTEGKSDACVLETALNILYPHLSEYYSFLDFKATRLRGSADALVSTIKAFISSGIANRTIAIFDNDTAGQEAMKLLSGIEIPNNIKVLKYPDLEIAKKYPTKGPTGDVVMDINGMACSIELYLGKDILTEDEDNLIPIQWIGYFESAGKYQGRILDKANCLKKFFDRMNDKDISRENFDFSGLDDILKMIFEAFN